MVAADVQCDGGKECSFDCSCAMNSTAAASTVNTYFFNNHSVLTWSGRLHLEGGIAEVSCNTTIPPNFYLHGYALTLLGTNMAFECPTSLTGASGAADWVCNVTALLSTSPLADGSTFTQTVSVRNAAVGLLSSGLWSSALIVLCAVIATATSSTTLSVFA